MVYSPQIKPRLVRKLYLLKQVKKQPMSMTTLANRAIGVFIEKWEKKHGTLSGNDEKGL